LTNKLRQPCEEIVCQILPAFRALIAKELIEKHKFTHKRAALVIGITRPAVSQYISSKRGVKKIWKLENIPEVMSCITSLAQNIANDSINNNKSILIICELCSTLRKNGLICEMYKNIISLTNNCELFKEK
jgi:predicted transcriptional regulator